MSGTPRGGCLSGRPGTLCETSNFHPRFCTHTAHDGPPVGSDSLGGVISAIRRGDMDVPAVRPASTDHIRDRVAVADPHERDGRSEEHTSELQSRENLVCRLLLEKKKYHQHDRFAESEAS